MYWPLGAPRSYAQQLPLELSQISRDGIEDSPPPVEDGGVTGDEINNENTVNTTSQHTHAEHSHQGSQAERDVNGPSKEAENLTDDGKILSLRVSRYGHIFATITSSSLTVWQTQVSISDEYYQTTC